MPSQMDELRYLCQRTAWLLRDFEAIAEKHPGALESYGEGPPSPELGIQAVLEWFERCGFNRNDEGELYAENYDGRWRWWQSGMGGFWENT